MKTSLRKNMYRDIGSSLSRFLAIVVITALGAFIFAGLRAASPDMQATADKYYADTRLMDYRLLSSVGFTDDDAAALRGLPGITAVQTSQRADALVEVPDGGGAFRIHATGPLLNQLVVVEGRAPEKQGECAVGRAVFRGETGVKIGDKLTITKENALDTLDMFAVREFTVVGIIESPMYITNFLGSTNIGSGTLSNFAYVTPDAFDLDVYTEVYLGADGDLQAALEAFGEERAGVRYDEIYGDAMDEINDAQSKLNTERAKADKELADAEKKIADGRVEYDKNKEELDALNWDLVDREALLPGMAPFVSEEELNAIRAQIAEGRARVDAGYAALADAKKELEDGEREYLEQKAGADAKLADAQTEIDDALGELSDLKVPKWYVFDRDSNSGYAGFKSDVGRIKSLSMTIPVFFFLVAALVCLTTMTRMVDEQRTQIGTIKALGFRRGQIMFKYMFYAASASLLGAAIGISAGLFAMPALVWDAYKILYRMPAIELGGNLWIIVNTLAAAVLSTVIPTWAACIGSLRENPAMLMRPKAPKSGARVLLERVTPVWRRLKFSHKVMVRNLFLNKRRFLMTVIGVFGCCALLLMGFGLRNSINGIAERQYSGLSLQDASVVLRDGTSSSEDTPLNAVIRAAGASALYFDESEIRASSDKVESTTLETVLIVPERTENLDSFLLFYDTVSREHAPIPLKPDGVIVTQKLAQWLKLSVGDDITIRTTRTDGGDAEATLPVQGISENYIGHRVYMTAETYAKFLGAPPEYDGLLLSYNGGDYSLDAVIADDNVLSAIDVTVLRGSVADMMKGLDSVVFVIIFLSIMLAFVVLYNLTNINITERARELATLKVLGFFETEVRQYIYRENRVLTVVGIVFGLIGGIFLTQYVILTAEVDGVMFRRSIQPLSYLWAALITAGAAELVNLVMSRPLRKINMVDSLKSAE
ncbi:hypothetical protein FACS1894202_06100 [Clostridia bacterium]|nr:hypothetical protein FACS1894202_06100 [Clostridia bacterium]